MKAIVAVFFCCNALIAADVHWTNSINQHPYTSGDSLYLHGVFTTKWIITNTPALADGTSCVFSNATWADGSDVIFMAGAHDIVIQGFTIRASANGTAFSNSNVFNGMKFTSMGANVTVRSNTIYDLFVRQANTNDCGIFGGSGDGIRADGAFNNCHFCYNNITNALNAFRISPSTGVTTNSDIYSNNCWNVSWGIGNESTANALSYAFKIFANRINNGTNFDGCPDVFHQDGIIAGVTQPNSTNYDTEISGNWIGPDCGTPGNLPSGSPIARTTSAIYQETTIDYSTVQRPKIYNNVIVMNPGQFWNSHALAWNANEAEIHNNTTVYDGVALHPDGKNAHVYNNLTVGCDTRYFINGAFTTNCAATTDATAGLDYNVGMNTHYWWNPGSYTYADYRDCGGTPGACCFSAYDTHSFNRGTFSLNPDYSPITGDTNIAGLGTNLSVLFAVDFYGNARPSSGAWTIGAFEAASVTVAVTNAFRAQVRF